MSIGTVCRVICQRTYEGGVVETKWEKTVFVPHGDYEEFLQRYHLVCIGVHSYTTRSVCVQFRKPRNMPLWNE